VLDLIWRFEPDDFRELGGQRRGRIYDNESEAVVLDLTARDGAVASYAWDDDGALSLAMIDGAGLRVWIARGIYATSGDEWVEHPLAEIQANAPVHLGIAEKRVSAEPDRAAPSRRLWVVLIILAVIAVVTAAVTI
jgi:hypothetical protein